MSVYILFYKFFQESLNPFVISQDVFYGLVELKEDLFLQVVNWCFVDSTLQFLYGFSHCLVESYQMNNFEVFVGEVGFLFRDLTQSDFANQGLFVPFGGFVSTQNFDFDDMIRPLRKLAADCLLMGTINDWQSHDAFVMKVIVET